MAVDGPKLILVVEDCVLNKPLSPDAKLNLILCLIYRKMHCPDFTEQVGTVYFILGCVSLCYYLSSYYAHYTFPFFKVDCLLAGLKVESDLILSKLWSKERINVLHAILIAFPNEQLCSKTNEGVLIARIFRNLQSNFYTYVT